MSNNSDNKDSLMKQIKKNFNINKKNWVQLISKSIFPRELIDYIQHIAQEKKNKKSITPKLRLSSRFSVLFSKKKKFYINRREEALERLICLINDCDEKMFKNQYPLADGKIDIVMVKNNNVNTIIELKNESNDKDSPLIAIIEIIKNYYLCKNNNCVSKMILLAPTQYYNNWFTEEKVKKDFKKFVNTLNNIISDAKIIIKSINIENWEEVLLNDIIKPEKWKDEEFDGKVNAKRGQYEKRKQITLKKYFEDNAEKEKILRKFEKLQESEWFLWE